jgi:DNA polymerase III subunit delta'
VSTSGWPGICGHEAVVRQLAQEVSTGRVHHAYLISGPEGVGKSTIASKLAQALLCSAPPVPGSFCGVCRACRKISRGVHPDVEHWSLESQRHHGGERSKPAMSLGIELVRSLSTSISMKPMESNWRLSIIDDAETLQPVAQEALLKTLEEPASFSVIILLCDDSEHLLPTIRSRCEAIMLRKLPPGQIEGWLVAEGVAAQTAQAVAGVAGGMPGWAKRATVDPSMLEERRIRIERAMEWVAADPFDRIVGAFRMSDEFSKQRGAVLEDLDTVATLWRDAIVTKVGQASLSKYGQFTDPVERLIQRWRLEEMYKALRSVQDCIVDVEANVRPRLAMEAMVLEWPDPR